MRKTYRGDYTYNLNMEKLPNEGNDTEADLWGSFNIEQFVEATLMFLDPEASVEEVEDGIEEGDDNDEDVAEVLGLVHSH